MGGSSNAWNEGACQWAIHAMTWAVHTFAALIYMHLKPYATQFKKLPDIIMPSPGHHGGGKPSDQHGQCEGDTEIRPLIYRESLRQE